MREWFGRRVRSGYERLLRREIEGVPTHIAVIQDGNRRYARQNGDSATEGHEHGAETTEQVLEWCQDLGIEELTLYTFSTENFDRPEDQLEALFDLIEGKLREFADAERVHDNGVCIRALGDIDRLPERVRDAVDYAEGQTEEYDQFVLNIALAYGGRAELLSAAQSVLGGVEDGAISPDEIDIETVENRLYERPVRDVDLIIRTGGDERTSNFLPWYANGNEAAVFFCTPYWPEFRKVDFLRAIRTYEHRQESWRTARARRALALLRATGSAELDEAKSVLRRFRDALPSGERERLDAEEFDADDRAAD
ncbi:tritrans,polycis-undecaprenyl-diphosphate synthase [geranylgeranyl-diphosphate specific] [Natronoarchaeum philippinense]|uniref:Tritrans,polycis-undecaprenyl-diphosphate synthase (geranylgeranyl-diphosphate specific) n=1 Tax=Natronoarchaeum philippinense TaxID=558529 RepID=A0A285NFY3_NATPI|nr:polyprenyl diphosphate synthase [Natronoarchaeum philippinense]SNZ06571.1 tritrans,polycis-undecaprenyl-diphosphate synthase [geranylgeranyl-diphosphate specific] [Natronoarchaeum philippinense]